MKVAALTLALVLYAPINVFAEEAMLYCATNEIAEWDAGKLTASQLEAFSMREEGRFVFDPASGLLRYIDEDGAQIDGPTLQFSVAQRGRKDGWDLVAHQENDRGILRIRFWISPMPFILLGPTGRVFVGTCEQLETK